MSSKPFGNMTLDDAVLKADKKKCRRYDQCGVGDRAVYLPSKMAPRKYYIPYEELDRVFKRVAVSPGSGKAFLTPVLYIVFQTKDGREQQVYFKYLNEADKLFDDLEKNHPDISLLSEEKEKKKLAVEEEEERIRNRELPREIHNQVSRLENAKELLGMRPKLYKELAASAMFKRKIDNIKQQYQILVGVILGIGVIVLLAGIGLWYAGFSATTYGLTCLIGIALIFIMLRSGILPTPNKNRKRANRIYTEAVEAMEKSLKKAGDFPFPACYAHPYVCDRCIRIIRTDRAKSAEEALSVLKEDLKKMDSSVTLGGEEYRQVVTIKPMFLVRDYE